MAEGGADIYPRASPTSEWDTAAGHAVLLAAGGLVDGPDGAPLSYGKSAFLNRAFVATSGWKPPRLDPYLEPFSGGGDLPQGVAKSKWDFVLQSADASIWVTGLRPKGKDFDLDPSARVVTGHRHPGPAIGDALAGEHQDVGMGQQ